MNKKIAWINTAIFALILLVAVIFIPQNAPAYPNDNSGKSSSSSSAKDMNMQIRIAVSPLVYDLFSIHRFYTRALSAAKYMNEAVIYLDDTKTLLDYMLSLSERENKDFIKRKISELEQNISKEDLDLCLLTAKAYYENDRHVGAAAEKLYIHKNTLMNRMKRVFKVKGVEPLLSVMAYSGAFPSFHHRRTTSPSVS